jgi:predicted 3-demethylubiquinone-9 3-methyltransferase (glyoxalase superfamily)
LKEKITPHLWFNKEAREAAEFYTSIFKGSKIKDSSTIRNTPSGDTDVVTAELLGQDFTLISAGPLFRFNPSISFLVICYAKEEVDVIWNELAFEGKPRMNLGVYPFSERYGWIEDKFGLSWQLMFARNRVVTQRIVPTLMFVDKVAGRAEEAIKFYVSLFRHAAVGDILRYGKGEEPDVEGTVKHASFALEGQEFAAMDSRRVHDIRFNEAISFMVHCETQEEIDYFWGRLSADPKAEQCGWLKDKYGMSWQIVPTAMEEMMKDKDETKVKRVTQAFLQMKKLDIEALRNAYSS